MKISLVLATVGRAQEIGRFVESLGSQLDKNFELIVVDQNDDDRLAPHLQTARDLGISVQHHRLNVRSLAGARNLGIRVATGEVMAFPDDDCWYEASTVAEIRLAFRQHPGWDGVVADWFELAASSGGVVPQGTLQLRDWRQFKGGHASSICLFFRSSLLRQLGGFDQRLGLGQWYGAAEEIDLVFRALEASAALGRHPAARINHRLEKLKTLPPGAAFAALRRARGTGALYAKHRIALWVVIRGLLAPIARSFWPWRGSRGLLHGAAISIGRAQGALRWLTTQENVHATKATD